MATSTSSQQRGGNSRLVRSYAAALKRAGVDKDDLDLLRELAELNARELAHPTDQHVPPSRLLLKAARPTSA